MKTFAQWCALNGVQPLPAAPVIVARFVSDIAGLGIDRVWEAVQEISRAHYVIGLADPTLGGPVALEINKISRIDAPRSWPQEEKHRFCALPYDLQLYISKREAERDKAVKRAQNEAAAARRTSKPENEDGTRPHVAA